MSIPTWEKNDAGVAAPSKGNGSWAAGSRDSSSNPESRGVGFERMEDESVST